MALELYDHPLSPYGQKVKIALFEKGVEFEGKLPNAIGSGQVDATFAAANPRGEVPALLDGDAAIFDSTVILEYIEDKWPTPALLPVTPIERARVRMLEDVMDTHFEAITWALSEIRNFGRAEGAEAERLALKARADGAHGLMSPFALLDLDHAAEAGHFEGTAKVVEVVHVERRVFGRELDVVVVACLADQFHQRRPGRQQVCA